jgi:hypothetical protein
MKNSLDHTTGSSTFSAHALAGGTPAAGLRGFVRKAGLGLVSIVLVALVLASPASAGFGERQTALFNEQDDHLMSMADSIERVLGIYIGSGGRILWNDVKLKAPYREFLDSQAAFVEVNDEMWGISQRAFRAGNTRFRKAARKAPRRCLRKAKAERRRASKAFAATEQGWFKAQDTQEALASLSMELWQLISDGSSNWTDGFLDGAIYAYGTDYMIAPPPGQTGERMDPNEIEPLMNLIYDAGSDTNVLYFSEFHKSLNSAIKQARKARSC